MRVREHLVRDSLKALLQSLFKNTTLQRWPFRLRMKQRGAEQLTHRERDTSAPSGKGEERDRTEI